MLLIGMIQYGGAQVVLTDSQAGQLVEKTSLVTDRDIYAVGETIQFSAVNCSSTALKNAEWSNVLYVELVAPDGESISRKKFAYDTDGASGSLLVPKWTLTGNYYVRAYTRWMRDFSAYNYFYKPVTVINSTKAELLELVEAKNGSSEAGHENTDTADAGSVSIKIGKPAYKKREAVDVSIDLKSSAGMSGNYTVSVIPEGAFILGNKAKIKDGGVQFSSDYIPETRGLSVSGTVVSQQDSLPLPYSHVALTVFKENPENFNVLSDAKGQFFFDLSKLKGAYEIFISADASDGKHPVILVDNDFSTAPVSLPFIPVDLSPEKLKVYQQLAFNSQMEQLYQQQKVTEEIRSFSSDSAFYGKPDFVLKFDKFIDLPTMQDYFYELVPQVRVREHNDIAEINVLGDHSELEIYDPLVLIDMVPIFDMERVLALQPEKLERIEVVTTPYVRGGIIFGGIVSLFSRKGDLAGIDLPSAGRFITYNMLSEDSVPPLPDHQMKHVPDLRNCLYWNPDLKVTSGHAVSFSFSTGDSTGKFVVVVQYLNENGEVKVAVQDFEIN